eukprot:TRINITY_DN1225_c1_g1_i2.p1 TRINITY_DN1225_c1_g1~~TRINITY_DN1225_c1_g1_i2.p1  ORF type:complete len:362 (+),score=31.99 TRINITY_DN1225_c1_g1_i2:497-1582(+)
MQQLHQQQIVESDSFEVANGLTSLAAFAASLRHLDIRGSIGMHAVIRALLGPELKIFRAGCSSEREICGSSRMQWALLFSSLPPDFVPGIALRCPDLQVLRLMTFTMTSLPPESNNSVDSSDLFSSVQFQNLRRLDLCCARGLDDTLFMTLIGASAKTIRSLNIRGCGRISDRSLLSLATSTRESLVHLNVSCCNFSEDCIRQLIVYCPRLKTLDLCYCENLRASLIEFLCRDDADFCPQLRMIGAGGLHLRDQEVLAICRKYSRTLEHLGIGSCEVTDQGLNALARLPHLKRLSAHNLRNVSLAGWQALRRQSSSLEEIDAEGFAEISDEMEPEQIDALEEWFETMQYSYSDSDPESDCN